MKRARDRRSAGPRQPCLGHGHGTAAERALAEANRDQLDRGRLEAAFQPARVRRGRPRSEGVRWMSEDVVVTLTPVEAQQLAGTLRVELGMRWEGVELG